MSDTSSDPRSFVVFRPVYEKLLGIDELRKRKESLRRTELLQERNFDIKRTEDDCQRQFIEKVGETLEKHYFEVAKPEVVHLDEASWKKGIVMKAKDILSEKASEFDYPEASSRGKYIRLSEEINKKSLTLERFAKSWRSLRKHWWNNHGDDPQVCESVFDQQANSAHRFFDLENCYRQSGGEQVLFQIKDLQNYFRRAQLTNQKLRLSPKALWTTAQKAISAPIERLLRSFDNLKQSFQSRILPRPKEGELETWIPENSYRRTSDRSLEADFPDNHWCTTHFSTFRRNRILSDIERSSSDVPAMHENLAVHELILLLRARIDMERIAMCEFLFQEQSSTQHPN